MKLQQLTLQPIRVCEFGWLTCTALRMTGMGASLRGGAFRADANAKLALQSSDEPWGLPDVSALSVNATARLKAELLMMLSSLLQSCRHNNTAQHGVGMALKVQGGTISNLLGTRIACASSSSSELGCAAAYPTYALLACLALTLVPAHPTESNRKRSIRPRFLSFLPEARGIMTTGRESSLLVYAKVLALMLV